MQMVGNRHQKRVVQHYANIYPTTESRVIYETPGVVLRPLPFYDLDEELIRPAGLISDGVVGRENDSRVEFRLTIDQADRLAMSAGSKRILLRFCHLDTTTVQDDNFPPDISVSINGCQCDLPQAISNVNKPNVPPKRPGRHVDITRDCKLCPYVQNVIEVKWYVDGADPSRSYVINVVIAERIHAETLLERIKQKGVSDPEFTRKLILVSDNEVATTNFRNTLICPLGKSRMDLPCKSIQCQHIPCFDALAYLRLNEQKTQWNCPVCDKPAHYSDLIIDGYFMDIIEKTDPNVTEVTINTDGSWIPAPKIEQPTAKRPPPEVITISDDDD